ncbi:MAG: DNA internalization-related competence protein ComEC/Rec2 [Nitrosomonadales bacterium]|nr:DNA internalization-related competence protein ComEC/Rec2 [Nitrosomonadales bacterium]
MVSFALFFTLGVWYLQQQAALPALPFYWPIAALALLLPRAENQVLIVARRLVLLACAAALGFGYAAWTAQQRLSDSLPDEWQGRNIVVTGIVAEMPRRHERGLRFAFDVEKVDTPDAHVPHRIQLSTYDGASRAPLNPGAGQRWQFTVRLKQPHGTSNPHNFDFEAWALERDIRAIGYVYEKGDNISLAEQTVSPAYLVQHLRETVRTHFQKTLGEAPHTGILTALAIGDQSGIGSDEWQLFTRTGTNHLMSISGLHITLLAGMIFALVYWLWQRSTRLTLLFPARKAAAIAGLCAALFYTLASGYEVPAQRTLYMVATFTLMLLLSRNVSPSQMLAAALLVVLLADPWAVLSPGFWLSFGAVALIFYVTANRLRKQHWLREYGRVQWAMTIGLIPPLLAMFQQLSLVAPVANAFAIPLVSFLVVPLTLLGTLPPFEWMLYLAHQALALCMFLLGQLDRLPFAVWLQHAPPAWTVVTGAAGALWMLAPRGFPMRWLGILLLLPMFVVAPPAPENGTARITIFDVGQGLAVSVQTRNHALLYDTGPDFSGEADSGSRILLPALRSMGIAQLDALVLSHDDSDHIGGTESILQGLPVAQVLTSLPRPHPRLSFATPSEDCHDGQSWTWDGVRFEMLHPAETSTGKTPEHDNERSCVLRIGIGQQSMLLAADIERSSEQRLLAVHQNELPATLLVAPHHGSKSSSSQAFVDAVHPRHVVFTAGYRNRFGHPREEVVARYRAVAAEVLRSDEDGAISIIMDDRNLSLDRFRRSHARYWQHSGGRQVRPDAADSE